MMLSCFQYRHSGRWEGGVFGVCRNGITFIKFTVKVYGTLIHLVGRALQRNGLAVCCVVCVAAGGFAGMRSTGYSNPNDSQAMEDK
jgi:hypothetical protein